MPRQEYKDFKLPKSVVEKYIDPHVTPGGEFPSRAAFVTAAVTHYNLLLAGLVKVKEPEF